MEKDLENVKKLSVKKRFGESGGRHGERVVLSRCGKKKINVKNPIQAIKLENFFFKIM